MSKSRRSRPPSGRAPRVVRARAGPHAIIWRRLRVVAPLVVLVAILGAWGAIRLRPHHDRTPVPADSLAAMDANTALLRGVGLSLDGRYTESLPFLRHALDLRSDLWEVHSDYGASLCNATVEVAFHRGILEPRSRSSWERAAMAREAWERFSNAERLAGTPGDAARPAQQRAKLLALWGLSWNALDDYRRASTLSPGSAPLARDAANHFASMKEAAGAAGH